MSITIDNFVFPAGTVITDMNKVMYLWNWLPSFKSEVACIDSTAWATLNGLLKLPLLPGARNMNGDLDTRGLQTLPVRPVQHVAMAAILARDAVPPNGYNGVDGEAAVEAIPLIATIPAVETQALYSKRLNGYYNEFHLIMAINRDVTIDRKEFNRVVTELYRLIRRFVGDDILHTKEIMELNGNLSHNGSIDRYWRANLESISYLTPQQAGQLEVKLMNMVQVETETVKMFYERKRSFVKQAIEQGLQYSEDRFQTDFRKGLLPKYKDYVDYSLLLPLDEVNLKSCVRKKQLV